MANPTTNFDHDSLRSVSRPVSRGRYGAALPFLYQDRPAPLTFSNTVRSRSRQSEHTIRQWTTSSSFAHSALLQSRVVPRPPMELINSYTSSSSQSSIAVIEADSWLPYERTNKKFVALSFAGLEREEELLRQRSSSGEERRLSSLSNSRSNGSTGSTGSKDSRSSDIYSETPTEERDPFHHQKSLPAENEQLKADIAGFRERAAALSRKKFPSTPKLREINTSQDFLDSVRDGPIYDETEQLGIDEYSASSQSRRYLRNEPLSQHDVGSSARQLFEPSAQAKQERRSLSIPRLPNSTIADRRRSRSLNSRRRPKVYYENVAGVRLDTMPSDASYSKLNQSLPEIEARDIRQIVRNEVFSEEDMSEYSSRHDHFAPAPPSVGSLFPTRSISPKPYYIPQERVFQDGYSLAAEADDPYETEFGMPLNVTATTRRINSANSRLLYRGQNHINGIKEIPVHPNLGIVPEEDDEAIKPIQDPAALRKELKSPSSDRKAASKQHGQNDSVQLRCEELVNAILAKIRSEEQEKKKAEDSSVGQHDPQLDDQFKPQTHSPRKNTDSYRPQGLGPETMPDWDNIPPEFMPRTPQRQTTQQFQETSSPPAAAVPTQPSTKPEGDSADPPNVSFYRDQLTHEGRRRRSSSISRTLPKFKNMLSTVTHKLSPSLQSPTDTFTAEPTSPDRATTDFEPLKPEHPKLTTQPHVPQSPVTSSSPYSAAVHTAIPIPPLRISTDHARVSGPLTAPATAPDRSHINGLAMHPPSPTLSPPVALDQPAATEAEDDFALYDENPRDTGHARHARGIKPMSSAESIPEARLSRFRRFERLHLDEDRPRLT